MVQSLPIQSWLSRSLCDLISSLNSALEELVADVCTDSGLDESKLDQGLSLRVLATRIGTTKLEVNTIAAYTRRLTDAKSELMVSMVHICWE